MDGTILFLHVYNYIQIPVEDKQIQFTQNHNLHIFYKFLLLVFILLFYKNHAYIHYAENSAIEVFALTENSSIEIFPSLVKGCCP